MTRRNRWSWTRRWRGIGLVGLVLLCALGGWPRGALAACGTFDPMACMDGAFYNNVLIPALEWLWVGARGWLILARIVEGVRTWLVTDVLSLAFDAIIAGIQFPFWIAALLATIVFAVAFALQGLVEGLHWVQVKRAVKYLALAVFLFNVGSPAVSASEQLRLAVGQGLAQIAGSSASQTSVPFYADDDSSMDAPHTIYGGETDCPGMSVVREEVAMYLNDYTANYLWATAVDIHCPSYADGSPQVPDEFARRYLPPEGQPVEDQRADERKRLIGLAWSGIGRLAMGTVLAIGATIEQALHLIYALALQAIWLGIFLSLLFVLFAPMEGVFHGQISSLKRLYFASWRAAFFLGLAMTLLHQAALAGNGLVVAGVGLGTVVLALWQTWVAGKVGGAAIDSFGQTLGMAPQAISGAVKGIGGGVLGSAVTAAALASGFGLPAAVGLGNAAKRSPGNAAFKWAMLRQRYGRQAARRDEAEERREAASERAERADARQDHRLDLDEARNAREQEAHEWRRQDRARGGAWYEDGGSIEPGAPPSSASSPPPPTDPAPTPEAQAEIDGIIALLRTPAPGDPGTGGAHAATGRQTPAPAGPDPARPDRHPARGEQPATEAQQSARPGETDADQAGTPRSDRASSGQPGGAASDQPRDRTLDPPTPDRDERELADRPARTDATADPQTTQGENAPQAVGGSRSPVHRDHPRTATPGRGPAPDPAPTPAPPATAPDRTARRAPHRIMTLAGRTRSDRPATGGTPRARPHLTTPRSASRRPVGPPASGGLPTSGTFPPPVGSPTVTTVTTRPAAAAHAPASPGVAHPPSASAPAVVSGSRVPAGPAAARSGPVSTPPAVTGTSAAQAAGPARPNARSVRPATTTRPPAAPNLTPPAGIMTGASVIDAARAPIGGSTMEVSPPAPATTPRPAAPPRSRPWAERARQRGTRQRTTTPAASSSDDPSRVT